MIFFAYFTFWTRLREVRIHDESSLARLFVLCVFPLKFPKAAADFLVEHFVSHLASEGETFCAKNEDGQ